MAQICDRCGKGVQFGQLVSHSNVKTKRKFKPNLQTVWVEYRGKKVKTKLCTKCIKLSKKAKKIISDSQTSVV